MSAARVVTAALPPRLLVAGRDLLSSALASALETCGFTTLHITISSAETDRGIEWQPDLVLCDLRPYDVATASKLIERFRTAGLRVCVIDTDDDVDRSAALLHAGSLAIIDKSEPFDTLFATVTQLLRSANAHASNGLPARRDPPTSAAPRDARLRPFASLTEREQVVLAELVEGHCAEDIAKASFVSISTVRTQIKAILQKLGVNSQLAAVAMARRAGWTLEYSPRSSKASKGRRSRVS